MCNLPLIIIIIKMYYEIYRKRHLSYELIFELIIEKICIYFSYVEHDLKIKISEDIYLFYYC